MKHKKKKIEYSKILAGWAVAIATVCALASFLMAWAGKNPCHEITISMSAAAVTVVDFYMHKSLREKDSRNRYGVQLDTDNNGADSTSQDETVG